MLEDSHRDNTDLRACAYEEVRGDHEHFDMMLQSELEVIGKCIDSIPNISRTRRRQPWLTPGMTPKGKECGTPHAGAARRKSDEDSAVVQRGSAMMSARS